MMSVLRFYVNRAQREKNRYLKIPSGNKNEKKRPCHVGMDEKWGSSLSPSQQKKRKEVFPFFSSIVSSLVA
jgi:hypothetical protein